MTGLTSLSIDNYGLIVGGIFVALGAVFVLIKNPKSLLHRSFFAFATGGALWMSGIGLISLTKSFAFDRLVNLGGLVFVVGFFMVARAIDVPMRFRVNKYFLYAPIVLDAAFVLSGDLINRGMKIGLDGSLTPVPGPFIVPHALLTLSYTVFGVAILAYKFRHSVGKERLRIKYMFLATGIFMATAVICDAVLPATGISSLNLIGPLSSIFFIGLTAYAILRHELMDIRIAIQRGMIYAALFALITTFYLGIVMVVGVLVGRSSSAAMILTSIITTIVGISTMPAIERYFRRVTDRFFFKDSYDYADALRELSAIVYTTIEFEPLVEKAQALIKSIFRCESVRIAISNEDHAASGPYMQALRVPIVLDGAEIGSISCGKKRSGDRYAPQDVKLIETFAYQAATALSRAKFYGEIKNYAETLESKVQERTNDLRQAQESQKQMMVDLSHNIQTPLAIFQTKIEQLKRIFRADPAVSNFEQSLKDLSSFIYNLMALAKLEHRTRPELATPVNVSALLADIADEVTVIGGSRGIAVRAAIAPDVFIKGNAKELREAILNLASNAVKYMRKTGKREIVVALTRSDGKAVLSVADTGVGIAEDDVKRLFERFYRARRSDNSIGTGLGLAVTRQIVDLHGGRIWCESREGAGATFFIELPTASL